MGDRTYDAIYKIAKTVESDVLILWLDHAEIRGVLLDCDESKCEKGVITLQDATVKCMKEKEMGDSHLVEKHLKWINISSCHIKAFTFKCCVID